MNIKTIFKYFWPHFKNYSKSGVTAFLMYFFGVIGSSIFSTLLYKKIIDNASSIHDMSQAHDIVLPLVFLLGINVFVYNVFYRIADFALTYAQSHAIKDLYNDAFQRLMQHSYEFFTNAFAGALVAKVKRYINAFEIIYDQIIFMAWMSGLRLIFALLVLLWLSPILSLIFFVWLVMYILMTFFFTKRKIKKDLLTANANSALTANLADSLTNMLNVKIFASHKKEYELFEESTELERNYRSKAWIFQNIQFAFQGYFIALFEFVGMYAVVTLWLNGYVSVGTIIVMQIYIASSFGVVWDMSRSFTRTMAALADAKEMVDIFEEPVSLLDSEKPERCRIKKGYIKMDNISFAYNNKNSVFTNFSLEIKPGEKVGLVGRSGAGKTTITKLLLRFVDVKEGKIFIDGQDISKITQIDLRKNIAYVPQDPVLFHRSLKENISYSRPNASYKDILKAAKDAHAEEFIKNLPKKYDTLVGERGVKLSGGERQRIAIARAMLKNSPILILDEATSSLDSISEKYIQDSFARLMKGRTTIVIAHRLSTLQKMDRIVVFDNGNIAEEGSHKKLLAKKGLYYSLWKQQSSVFVE